MRINQCRSAAGGDVDPEWQLLKDLNDLHGGQLSGLCKALTLLGPLASAEIMDRYHILSLMPKRKYAERMFQGEKAVRWVRLGRTCKDVRAKNRRLPDWGNF